MLSKALLSGVALVGLAAAGPAWAQGTGTVDRAASGYDFSEAVKANPDTANFHSADDKLTFAIITHTAGNGFFDPTYVGAQVAADAFGINLIRLGSEAPVDDIPRELEIINQILQDPTLDGLIITTPQSGAYDDIVQRAFDMGIPVATTNSFDPAIRNRNQISHTGQQSSAAGIGGEALARCVMENAPDGGTILFPSTTTLGNVEVNNRVTAAFQETVAVLNAEGVADKYQIDAGPTNIGVDIDANNATGSVVSLIESRGDVVGLFGANAFVTPAIADAVTQLGMADKVCSYGFDLGPKQLDAIKSGALDGSLGQQPFLQGFWPVVQLYLQIDRNVSAADLDTKAQLVTKDTVGLVGQRYEN